MAVKNKIWTEEEKAYLLKKYADTPDYLISEKINRTIHSIRTKARDMKLLKSESFMKDVRIRIDEKVNKTPSERFNIFMQKANKLHENKYDYSKFIFVNSRTSGIITCRLHGDFKSTPSHHLSKPSSVCPKCYKIDVNIDKKRFDYFLQRAKKLHNNKFDYSKFIYVSAKTKGIIICPIHGEFSQNPDKHLGKDTKGCQKCWFEIRNEMLQTIERTPRAIMSKDEFLKRCFNKYGDRFKYDLTNYNGLTKNKINVICSIHGEFSILPCNHILKTSEGCQKCGRVRASKNKTRSYDDFLIKSNQIHKYKYIYSEENNNTYKNKKSIVKIICKEHGEFKKKAQKHIAGQGCFRCKIDELIKNNTLCGGYCENLFEKKPFLKDKKSYLYYLKINDGELYKIGITTKEVSDRINSLKSISKGNIKKVEIISQKEYTLYDSFTIEQKILVDFIEFRKVTFWSGELFTKNIYNKIKKYLN